MKVLAWRLRNIYIFLVTLGYMLLRGSGEQKPEAPKKIIIVQGARLGDMVCTTPLFRAVKEKYPNTEIVVVGDSVNEKLLVGLPDVNRYIVWTEKFWRVVRLVRREQADFGIVCLPSLEGLAILILGGVLAVAAPKIVGGYSPYETKTYRFLRRFVISVPHHFDHYVPREYLRLLEPIGIVTDNTKKHLVFSAKARMTVEDILCDEGVSPKKESSVGILPGVGGDPLKRWAPEKFARIVEYLTSQYGMCVIIIGSGRDENDVKAMLSHISSSARVVNLFGRLTIEELKALIASLSLFISADTGPIYIAEAFGIPTIDIVGPVKEFVQPPRGDFHRVVAPDREKGVLGVLDNIPTNKKKAQRQSEVISAEMVMREIDALIPFLNRTSHSSLSS